MPRWTPALATGRSDIDAQHQELFRRAEAVDTALSEGRFSAEIAEMLRFLVEYCEKHFATERALMYRCKYPDATAHLAEHASFTKSIRAIQRDAASGGRLELAAQRLNELVLSWLVKHIETRDMALGSFLREHAELGGTACIGWDPSLAIGVPELDAQHRTLLGHAARLEDAVAARAPSARLEELFGFLAEYVRGHFAAEEQLMRDTCYPRCAEHRQEHLEFTRRLKLLVPLWEAEGESAALCHVLVGFVQAWVVDHVRSSDQRLGDHLGLRAVGAS